MNIDFKVLWFEDDKDWYDSILPVVDNYLNEKGFNFIPSRYQSGENLEKILKEDDYDLVLVDYNLPGELGDKLIERVRHFELYTDIIFYSQNGEDKVRSALAEKAVEGVFCADRSRDEFEEKVTNIIHSNIKKVLDLTNMRGIIVTKTSDLDLVMDSIIIKKVQNSIDEIKNDLRKSAKEKAIDSLKDKLTKIENIDLESEFGDLVNKLESYNKWRMLLKICKVDEDLKEFKDIVNDYNEEIIDVRNKMAHLKETIEGGNKVLKSSDGSSEFIFNDAKSIEVRNNIKKFDETFENILDKL